MLLLLLREHFSFHVIDQVFQFLAGLEVWDLLGWNFNPRPRFGVAAHARAALARAEAAKAANLNLVTGPQGADYAVKDGFHNDLAVLARQFGKAGDFFNQIGFGHGSPYSTRNSFPRQETTFTETVRATV